MHVKVLLCFESKEPHVCPNLYASEYTIIMRMLNKHLSNLGLNHWKATKRVIRYLHRTKNLMLTNQRFDHLEVIRYSNSNFF